MPTARRKFRSSRSASRPTARASTSPAASEPPRRTAVALAVPLADAMTALSIPRLLEPVRCVWNAAALLGEGTCWSVREQALWWVDILGHRLHRYTPQTDERRTWTFDETISAVAERARGPGLIVALQHRFALFDPADG